MTIHMHMNFSDALSGSWSCRYVYEMADEILSQLSALEAYCKQEREMAASLHVHHTLLLLCVPKTRFEIGCLELKFGRFLCMRRKYLMNGSATSLWSFNRTHPLLLLHDFETSNNKSRN